MTATGAVELLARARSLEASQDHAAIVALLEPADAGLRTAEPELGYRLAYAWRRVGRTGDALSLTEALDAPVRRRAEDPLARRRLSLEAMLRYDIGEVRQAEQLWEQLAAEATEAGDHFLAAAASNNLGVVRTLQDRPDEALASYSRALLAYRGLGDRRGLAQAHQNLAILFREKELPREAGSHFRRARAHAQVSGSEDVLGRVEEERALLFLDEADEPMATEAASRALRRLQAIADSGGVGEAHRVLGIVALRRRDMTAARSSLDQAIASSRATGNMLLQAETLEALALLEQAQARGTKAATHRREAEGLFERMGAAPWGRRIRARTASLSGL